MKILLCFLLLLITSGSTVFERKLKSIDGEVFDLRNLKKQKAVAFIFLLADCPACQSYSLTLNELSKRYTKEGIAFVGIFPGTFASNAEMKSFRKDYQILFPLLHDPDMSFAKQIKATKAPEVFLVDGSGSTIYSGRIDDWMYTVGKKRMVIRKHDLEDAIKSVIKGKPVNVRRTEAIGCILQYD